MKTITIKLKLNVPDNFKIEALTLAWTEILEAEELAIPKLPKIKEEIDWVLAFLKQRIWIWDFTDRSNQVRNFWKHHLNLWRKLWKDEYLRRLDALLSDDFTAKNCNNLWFLYRQIKGFKDAPIDKWPTFI